ncbi:hypothetical protein BS78_03G012300 [Paspalum vaginatum]|nr:hypothetical protein BS78_03G012300 [Paspalum vaginatum]
MLAALARRIDEARRLPSRNAVSWNAMTAALSDHGRAADARSLFDKMLDWDGFLWTLMICSYACWYMLVGAQATIASQP